MKEVLSIFSYQGVNEDFSYHMLASPPSPDEVLGTMPNVILFEREITQMMGSNMSSKQNMKILLTMMSRKNI